MAVSHSADELVRRQTSRLGTAGLAESAGWDIPVQYVSRTYLVPALAAGAVLRNLRLTVIEEDGNRFLPYQSVYFDTPELTFFHRLTSGRRIAPLVRTRTQLDSGRCELEIEWETGRGETTARRIPYDSAERFRLTPEGRAHVASHWTVPETVDALAPTMNTVFRRATFVDTSAEDHLTLDLGLCFRQTRAWVEIPGRLAVLRTGATGAATRADRALQRAGFRPESFNEYCAGMAILNPDLSANQWNRTLRRHFGWAPIRPGPKH